MSVSDVKGDSLVSIIIPTHNRVISLERAIASCLAQTYTNLEILVVDDASTPPAVESISELYRNHAQITWSQNEANRGAPFSRNVGLQKSKGDFICFLDDDDELYPDKIARQVEYLADTNDTVFGVTHDVQDERFGEKMIIQNRQNHPSYRSFLRGFANTGTEAVLYKRACLLEVGGFDETLPSSQEYDLLIRLSEHRNLDYLPYTLSRRHVVGDSISQNLSSKFTGSAMIYKRHHRRFFEEGGIGLWALMTLKYSAILTRIILGQILGVEIYKRWVRQGMKTR